MEPAVLPQAIRHAARQRAYAAGQVLARQGQRPRHVYYVMSGEVRLVRAGRTGETAILQRVRHGWVAEASLFATSYHCDLVAGTAAECLQVPAAAIAEALEQSPEFTREWLVHLSTEVRRLRGVRERLGLRGAQQRVVHAIESEGTGGRLQIAGSAKDWAFELGLTHEALYRTLARMERDGALRRGPGWLELVARRPR
jgi:CRP-like cAMP-binding protein